MKSERNKLLKQTIELSALAGLRSMSAPALVSNYFSRHPNSSIENSPLKFIQSKKSTDMLMLLATAELAGDKVAKGNRISPPQLIGRCLSGALVGASLYKANQKSSIKGAVIGGLSAFASTFVSFYLRKGLGKISHVPDKIIGAVEDAFVAGMGYEILKDKPDEFIPAGSKI